MTVMSSAGRGFYTKSSQPHTAKISKVVNQAKAQCSMQETMQRVLFLWGYADSSMCFRF